MMYTDKKLPIKHTIQIPQKTATTTTQTQKIILGKFMVRTFITGIKLNYSSLFINEIDIKHSSSVFETILKRSGASNMLFKKVCCVVIKFLQVCKGSGISKDTKITNYMKNLHYDLHKLLVAAFVICTCTCTSTGAFAPTNTPIQENEKSKIQVETQGWHAVCKLYSVITGISIDEIANCYTIVRMVLHEQSQQQIKSLNWSRHQHRHSHWQHIENGKAEKACVCKSDIDEFDKMSKALVTGYFKVI